MGSKWGYQEQKGGEFVKIDKLTDEQKSQMIEHRDNLIAIGLETKPANRSLAEIAVADMYRLGGLPPPARIVWCGSPLSNVLTWASVWASVRDSVGDSVGASVWASVGASVRDSVGDSVGASVWASVRDSVWASVGASVRDSVGDSVGASVWASVGASVRDSVWAS